MTHSGPQRAATPHKGVAAIAEMGFLQGLYANWTPFQ